MCFHTAPTRTMLADGLAQYLIWKQWRSWVLLYGSHDRDQLFADALRRAATRFGGEIVAEKEFKDTGTARRTDSRRRADPAADAGFHPGPARP